MNPQDRMQQTGGMSGMGGSGSAPGSGSGMGGMGGMSGTPGGMGGMSGQPGMGGMTGMTGGGMGGGMMGGKMKVFASGATGNVGSRTLKYLCTDFKDRVMLKAGIHAKKPFPEMLKGFNIEQVPMDYADSKSICEAVKGCDIVLAIPGQQENRHQLIKNFIDNCKQCGVKQMILFSAADCDCLTNTIAKQFKEMEDHLKKSGMQWTIMRCNMFMDNVGMLKDPIINRVEYPHPLNNNGSFCPIAIEDAAYALAMVTAECNKHAGKMYTLSGPEDLTGKKEAEGISRALQKDIKYIEVEPKKFKEFMTQKASMPEWQAQAISEMFDAAASGKAQKKTKDFEMVTGRKPASWEQYLNQNKQTLFPTMVGQQAR